MEHLNLHERLNVKRVLVAHLRHHGDVLLSSALFSELKRSLPHAKIDAYIYSETKPMLEGHPAISHFCLYEKNWKKLPLFQRLYQELKLLRGFRKRGYDLVINLTEGDRGAIAARVTKARYRVGFDPKGSGMRGKASIYTHLIKEAPHPRHTVEKLLDAGRVLGMFPSEEKRELFFNVPQQESEKLDALLEKEGIKRGEYIVVHPVSRWMFKCPPAAFFIDLIKKLKADGHSIVVTSSPDAEEMRHVAEIEKGVTFCNMAGKSSLKGLGAIIEGSRALISVDSVPVHLSSALKVPVVAIFGPTSDLRWGPWRNPKSRVVFQEMSCRPCYHAGCGDSGVSDCLETLSPERVLNALDQIGEKGAGISLTKS